MKSGVSLPFSMQHLLMSFSTSAWKLAESGRIAEQFDGAQLGGAVSVVALSVVASLLISVVRHLGFEVTDHFNQLVQKPSIHTRIIFQECSSFLYSNRTIKHVIESI